MQSNLGVVPFFAASLCLLPVTTSGGQIEPANVVTVQRDEVLIAPDRDWSAAVRAPRAEGQRVVLSLDARLHVAGSQGGGCNWMLRIFIDDDPLIESPARPRLLNKAPSFDFSDGKYHFTWFSRAHKAWMALFADSYDANTAGTGQDTAFLFDLSDYVNPGQPFRLRMQYAQPNIPSALQKEAPLAVRNIAVGTLPADMVERLRDEALSGEADRRDVPIQAALDPDEQPGETPYEILWSGRAERPPPQVTFEDLGRWRAAALGEFDVELRASQARRVWRSSVLKVTVGECPSFTLMLLPPSGVRIPDDTNAANCWVHSDHSYGATGGPVELLVTIEDARGACADLPCGSLRGDYWEMKQGLLTSRTAARLRPPLKLHSITLAGQNIKRSLTMHLESLTFFKRVRKPYSRLTRRDDPPFPASEENMLPPAPPDCEERVAATREGPGAVFTSASPAGTLTYTVRPETGGLDDLVAQFGDGPSFRPLAGGGLRVQTDGGPLPVAGAAKLLSSRVEKGKLLTSWTFSVGGAEGRYQLSYRLRGRTLIVDVECAGGVATALDLGKVRGLPDVRGVEVPYLVFHSVPGPRTALGGGAFVSALIDWYHSNCSTIDTTSARDEADEDGLRIGGAAIYAPLTNGKRNDLRERVLLTVSPEFHDTLPSTAAYRSSKLEELAPSMFVMSSHFTPTYYRTLKRYGLDHLIAIHFAGIWWTRAGEGFAMRWRPRPGLTERDVAEYRGAIRALGYKWGMLVNYTCYLPLNEYWDENKVSLTGDGRLADGWYGHYRTKPNAMPELARVVGAKIRERYATDCVYLDVHTNRGAHAIDYEAGVEGAGTARGAILGNAECVREVHQQQSALCSEGICRWIYAGLADMDYAQWVGTAKPEHKPLLPDFDLLRIHPLQIGTAMGYSPRCFFTGEGLERYHQDPGVGTGHQPFYHYVAATLAHGHSAMIGYGYFPPPARTIHYYALLAGPQADYLTDTVSHISWHDEEAGRFVSTSEALRTAARDAGKLRVTYFGGQSVHVNYHPERSWRLKLDDREFVLPPYGWLIHKPGELFAYSALVDGRRVDYVECPEYIYLNSGDRAAAEGAITVDGAVFIRRSTPLAVIPCGNLGGWKPEPCERYPVFTDRQLAGVPADRGVRLLRVDASSLLGVDANAEVTVRARDEAATPTGSWTCRASEVRIEPEGRAVDYLLE